MNSYVLPFISDISKRLTYMHLIFQPFESTSSKIHYVELQGFSGIVQNKALDEIFKVHKYFISYARDLKVWFICVF